VKIKSFLDNKSFILMFAIYTKFAIKDFRIF